MVCEICRLRETNQIHHCVFRSHVPALIKCELNYAYICDKCHTKLHGKYGHELDIKLKLRFQNSIEILFDKEYLTCEDIKEVLKISDRCMRSLLKTVSNKNGLYKREDIIRRCMGGRIYE